MSFADAVSRLVDLAGETITYRQVTSSAFAVVTGRNTPTFSDTVIKASVRKYMPEELTGGLVQQGDRKVHIAADDVTFTPQQQDQVVIGGDTFLVMAVEVLTAKDDEGLFVLQVRGE